MTTPALQINRIRPLVLGLPWIGLALQILISSQPLNVACALLAAFSGWLLLFDSFRQERWQSYPLSSFALLGIVTVKSVGPLWFTAFEGHALIYNLTLPLRLFGELLLLALVAMASHWLYRQQHWLQQLRWGLARGLGALGVTEPLSRPAILWLTALGASGWAASITLEPGSIDEPLAVKVAEAFTLLSSVVVVLVCRPLMQERSGRLRALDLQLLAAALVLLLLISFAVNLRSVFAVPLLSLVLALLLEGLFGLIRFRLKVVLPLALATVLGMPFLSDLATTIVLTREYRSTTGAAEMVSMTLQQLGRRDELLERRQEDREAGSSDWDEAYLDNVFLARFCNLKFDDNALALAQQISPAGRELLRSYYAERLIATAPRQLLALFGIANDDKIEINGRSFGDELYALTSGDPYARGGFRTGHFIGSDGVVFGWWSLPLLALVLLPLFAMVDALQARPRGSLLMNPLVITQLVPLLTLSNSESLVTFLQLMLRVVPQVVLTYAVAAWVGRGLFPAQGT